MIDKGFSLKKYKIINSTIIFLGDKKMKLLAIIIIMFCPTISISQTTYSNGNNSITFTGNDVTISHSVKPPIPDGDVVVMTVESFNNACKDKNIDIKEHDIWACFWLPVNSETFTLYIRKDSINSKNIILIKKMINEQLYIKTWEYVSRQGFDEVKIQADSQGNWSYSKRNDWVGGLNGMRILDNGMLVMYNGPIGFNPRPGDFPFKMNNKKERISKDKEMFIYVEKKKAKINYIL